MTEEPSRTPVSRHARFATTRWSIALAAVNEQGEQSKAALNTLCEIYWPPLYGYLRRRGCSPQEAEDVLQGFFARLLQKGDLKQISPERGRFRSFLLAGVKHFLSNERDRTRAIKRGGSHTLVSLDVNSAEQQYQADAASLSEPESTFERQWALTLLEQVRNHLRSEFESHGKLDRFEILEPCLAGDANQSYKEIAKQLDLSENAVKVAIHRLREQFRKILRMEIAQTVASDDEVDDEIHALFEALRK